MLTDYLVVQNKLQEKKTTQNTSTHTHTYTMAKQNNKNVEHNKRSKGENSFCYIKYFAEDYYILIESRRVNVQIKLFSFLFLYLLTRVLIVYSKI